MAYVKKEYGPSAPRRYHTTDRCVMVRRAPAAYKQVKQIPAGYELCSRAGGCQT